MLLAISLIRHLPFVTAANARRAAAPHSARVENILHQHLDAVWRTARRLGVPERDLDDVAQEVFVVVIRRLNDIQPDRERAFVVAATVRITANWRRSQRRRPEELTESMDLISGPVSSALEDATTQERSVERTRKLLLLEAALTEMTEPQRVAFVMFELEQLTAREIAQELELPEAAVVSRVRRAREVFQRCCARKPARPHDAKCVKRGGTS